MIGDDTPVALDDDAVAVLTRHGVLDVLRPYLTPATRRRSRPRDFEEVVKHHCVADLNVTVYDEVHRRRARPSATAAATAVLTDGTSRWELHADRFVDADLLPSELSAAVIAGAAAALARAGRSAAVR